MMSHQKGGSDGPTIRLRGEWLASAQQASRLEAQSSELHAKLAARDANNQALLQRCYELEIDAQRARAELADASVELGKAKELAASARAEAIERAVEARTLALDLPIFEKKHSDMLKTFQSLQQRTVTAEHARQLAEVGASAAATELDRMTKLLLGANAQVTSLKQKLRGVEDELVLQQRRVAEQQRHAHVLQRERERLNDLITECRRQMKVLKSASASAAAAYAARRAGGHAAAAAEQAAAEPLCAPVTARWTGGASAAAPASPPPAPPADELRTPAPPSDGAGGSGGGFGDEASLSGARTGKAAAPASADKGRADGGKRPASAREAPAGKQRGAAYLSPEEVNSVRTKLFGAGPGSGNGGDASPERARRAAAERRGPAGSLEAQDDAYVSVRPSGLAPSSRFRNWEAATAEEREHALRAENGTLLTALQTQLQRCGLLEQTVAQLRAENVQLKFTRPRTASAARAPGTARESARAHDGKGAAAPQREPAAEGAGSARANARKAPLPAAARVSPRARAAVALKP